MAHQIARSLRNAVSPGFTLALLLVVCLRVTSSHKRPENSIVTSSPSLQSSNDFPSHNSQLLKVTSFRKSDHPLLASKGNRLQGQKKPQKDNGRRSLMGKGVLREEFDSRNRTGTWSGEQAAITQNAFQFSLDSSHFHSRRVKRGSMHGPMWMDKQTLFVEIVVVTDYSMYRHYTDHVSKRAQRIINYVNAIFNALDVVVVLREVRENKIQVSRRRNRILEDLVSYRQGLLRRNPQMSFDNVMLITREEMDGGSNSMDYKGKICSAESVSIVQDNKNSVVAMGHIAARELGRSLGIGYDEDGDSVTGEPCECEASVCVMTAEMKSANRTYGIWSSCSKRALARIRKTAVFECLENMPTITQLHSEDRHTNCGNGIVEDEEQCDCGPHDFCNNPCCIAETCKLAMHASCASGACCDTKTCKPRPTGDLCRKASGDCDLPEFCAGHSEYCPEDAFVQNGHPCSSGQMCESQKCETGDRITGVTGCPGGCSGHGVCNNRGQCHCDEGYSPPYCNTSGHGGSVHSNPSRNPIEEDMTALVVCTVFMVLLTIVVIVCCVSGPLQVWWEKRGRDCVSPVVPCCVSCLDECCCLIISKPSNWMLTFKMGDKDKRVVRVETSTHDSLADIDGENDGMLCSVDIDIDNTKAETNSWGVADERLVTEVVSITPKNSPDLRRKIRFASNSPVLQRKDSNKKNNKPIYQHSISADSGCVSDEDTSKDRSSMTMSLTSLLNAFRHTGSKTNKEHTENGIQKSRPLGCQKSMPLSRFVVDPLASKRNSRQGTPPPELIRPDYRRAFSTDAAASVKGRPGVTAPPPPPSNLKPHKSEENILRSSKLNSNSAVTSDKGDMSSRNSVSAIESSSYAPLMGSVKKPKIFPGQRSCTPPRTSPPKGAKPSSKTAGTPPPPPPTNLKPSKSQENIFGSPLRASPPKGAKPSSKTAGTPPPPPPTNLKPSKSEENILRSPSKPKSDSTTPSRNKGNRHLRNSVSSAMPTSHAPLMNPVKKPVIPPVQRSCTPQRSSPPKGVNSTSGTDKQQTFNGKFSLGKGTKTKQSGTKWNEKEQKTGVNPKVQTQPTKPGSQKSAGQNNTKNSVKNLANRFENS